MLFNSFEFLIFFPIVFALYWLVLQKSRSGQNTLLLVASYVFYGWWDWRFLSLIVISSVVDYFIGLQLGATDKKGRRKALLASSLVVNLGILGFFKYFNFFADSFADMMGAVGWNVDTITLNIILPVGISFYTFQTLSYTLDIYYKRLEPTRDALSFFTFVAFFPQLVAGPIERARNLLPQFQTSRKFDYKLAASGGKLVLIGFFKKLVIADNVAPLVDTVFNSPADYTGLPLIVASIFFAFQIYCDFSGYSDIAIGTARILGFNLMTNFNKPYFAMSLTEFWRRWHISLSTWFRDYVYIPLGGSRTSKGRNAVNIMITFVVSGLWHGANWTFVIWGAIHGFGLVIERLLKGVFSASAQSNKLIKLIKLTVTFAIVVFCWIFFRANTLTDAVFIVKNMFTDIAHYTDFLQLSLNFRGMGLKPVDLITPVVFILVLLIIETLEVRGTLEKVFTRRRTLKWAYYYFLLTCIVFWGTDNAAQNFIYFQF